MGNDIRIRSSLDNKAANQLEGLRRKFQAVQKEGAKGFAIGVGAGVAMKAVNLLSDAVSAVGGAIYGSISSAVAFEKALANIKTINPATDIKKTGDAVLKMSGQFAQSTDTLTTALYNINSASFQGAEGLKVLEASARAGVAGLSTAEDAASGITSVLNAYGLSGDKAGRISDVMFKTVQRGVTTFGQFSAETGKLAAVAAPLGVSFEEVAAAFAVLTRHGIATADAATQINAIMISMLKPSKQAADYAKELGISWDASTLKSLGLVGALKEMIRATGGSSEKMAVLLGNSQSIRGAFALAAESGQEFTDELVAMEDSVGATDEAFETMAETADFALRQTEARVAALGTAIGAKAIPQLTWLNDRFGDLLTVGGALFDIVNGEWTPEALALANAMRFISQDTLEAGLATIGYNDAIEAGKANLPIIDAQRHGQIKLAGAMSRIPAAAKEVFQRVPAEWRTAGDETERLVADTMSQVAQKIREGREAVVNAIRGIIDDTYDPLINAGKIAAIEAELASKDLRDALKDKDPEIKADAKLRRLELRKSLAQLVADQTQYGDAAARMALLKAQLVSSELIAGLRSGDPARRQAARDATQAIVTEMSKIPGPSTGWGSKTGNAYADGLINGLKTKYKDFVRQLFKYRDAMKASSPPGPKSPLHLIDKWGERTGEAWSEGLTKGLGGANIPNALAPIAGGLAGASGGGGGGASVSVTYAPGIGFGSTAEMQRAATALVPELVRELQRQGFVGRRY